MFRFNEYSMYVHMKLKYKEVRMYNMYVLYVCMFVCGLLLYLSLHIQNFFFFK